MKRLLALISLGLAACGNGLYPDHVDTDLEPLVSVFYADVQAAGLKTSYVYSVTFGTIKEKDVLGLCYPGLAGVGRHIVISRARWNESSPALRAHVIYHELVHCALDYMQHDENGLMAPYANTEETMDDVDAMYQSWLASH